MNERIIVDSDGRVLKRSNNVKAIKDKMKMITVPKRRGPTTEELEKLENAIFSHGEPYREKFLKTISAEGDFSDYLSSLAPTAMKKMTLRAWVEWGWRPDVKGVRVYVVEPKKNVGNDMMEKHNEMVKYFKTGNHANIESKAPIGKAKEIGKRKRLPPNPSLNFTSERTLKTSNIKK